jgi:hypothetical protein
VHREIQLRPSSASGTRGRQEDRRRLYHHKQELRTRTIYRSALTLGTLVSLSGIALGQASSVPASSATSGAQQGVVVVQADVLIPLIDEPEYHFHLASRYFSERNDSGSPGEIRIAAALLEIEAARHDATNKAELDAQAQGLNELSAKIAKGFVKSLKELNNDFASADRALARHYHRMVAAPADENAREKTGYWLHGTVNSLTDSARWSDHTLAEADR